MEAKDQLNEEQIKESNAEAPRRHGEVKRQKDEGTYVKTLLDKSKEFIASAGTSDMSELLAQP